MIGLDTNVLVRYFAQDDPVQSSKATTLIGSLTPEDPGFVAIPSVVELVWVLARAYQSDRIFIIHILEELLRAKEIIVEQSPLMWQALHLYKVSKADFADCLIERSCQIAGCHYTVTFDAIAAKTAGMRLIK
ncbi:PIN domain-containing protein [Acidobacterium sp. S8]|uniref:PIN domain-containing protein n=1 Tax=Acidobacterium sp. S8 TaxID=1641854 RepID=UPI00131CCB03|nr:type II toxin-antitoxin system VapC family toxin [Acidobacterium sp. S8]